MDGFKEQLAERGFRYKGQNNAQGSNNNNDNNSNNDDDMSIDMMDNGSNYNNNMNEDMDPQRQRLLTAQRMLDISNQRIENSERIALESENIGIDILNELAEQRESLVRTSQHLDDADRSLRQTDGKVTSMLRRNLLNKLIWFAIIFVILAIIIVSIVSKLT